MTSRIVTLTGATGFIGRHVCRAFLERGWTVRGAVRDEARAVALPRGVHPVRWDADRPHEMDGLLDGAQVVVHLAGRAHVLDERPAGSAERYHGANVTPTAALVTGAREAGVRRFVYVSSIKVLGERSTAPFADDARIAPADAYARSKADAEAVVRATSAPMEWTIVRPSFVYGPGGKGNVTRLLRLAQLAARVPLPLSGIANRRSVAYVENLAELIAFLSQHPDAANRTLPGADSPVVSTPELLRELSAASGARARLFPLPEFLLSTMARAVGRAGDWRRLTESLEVDTGALTMLGWRQPHSLSEGLRRTVAGFDQSTDD